MYVEKPVKVTDGDTIDITNKGKFTTKSSNDKDDVGAVDDFAIMKKVARYRKMSQCEGLSYEEKDVTEYTLDTDHAAFEIGNMVKRDGKELYVKEVDIKRNGNIYMKAKLIKDN